MTGSRMGDDLLRQAGQGVVLGQDADHRLARAVAGDERRRHAGDARLHVEAGRLELLDQQGAGTPLLQAHLGELPDGLVHRSQLVAAGLDVGDGRLLRRAKRLIGPEASGHRQQEEYEQQGNELAHAQGPLDQASNQLQRLRHCDCLKGQGQAAQARRLIL